MHLSSQTHDTEQCKKTQELHFPLQYSIIKTPIFFRSTVKKTKLHFVYDIPARNFIYFFLSCPVPLWTPPFNYVYKTHVKKLLTEKRVSFNVI